MPPSGRPPARKSAVRKSAVHKSTTTYGFRRMLKVIKPPGKRATPEARKAHRGLLADLLTREKGIKTPAKATPEKPGQEYTVEKLLDSRVHKKVLEFLVLWEGYPLEESTWEPHSNLKHCKELIDEFFKGSPNKPGAPAKKG